MYKFIEDITKPFTQLAAYKAGLIDHEGYFKESEDVIAHQIPAFDLFVIYIKRLLDQIPNPSTSAKLKSFTSAMSLFKESLDKFDLDGEYICENILLHLAEQEVAAPIANNVGSGEIAGLGYRNYEDGYDDILVHPRNKCKDKDNPLCNVVKFMDTLQRRNSK
jgi:hypothetical protein